MLHFNEIPKEYLLEGLIIILAILTLFRPGKHYWKLRKAKRVYRKIQELEDSCVIPYLRKIDPFVFEELVLWAFRQKGYKVYRNARYTGDGGIDGKVKMDGRKVLIQDKRYSGYIQLTHVRDFEALCRNKHRKGIFVHTGKSGKGTKEVAFESDWITIVSGNKLVQLLRQEH